MYSNVMCSKQEILILYQFFIFYFELAAQKPQNTEFHASLIKFCNFDPPYLIRHIWLEYSRIWPHIRITGMISK